MARLQKSFADFLKNSNLYYFWLRLEIERNEPKIEFLKSLRYLEDHIKDNKEHVEQMDTFYVDIRNESGCLFLLFLKDF